MLWVGLGVVGLGALLAFPGLSQALQLGQPLLGSDTTDPVGASSLEQPQAALCWLRGFSPGSQSPRTVKSRCPTTCPLDSLPPPPAQQPRDPTPLWILLSSWMEDSLGGSGKSKECPREVPGSTLAELCPAASRRSQGWTCPGAEASGDNQGPDGHAGGRKPAVVSPWHRSLFQRGWEGPVHMLVHSLHPCAPRQEGAKPAPWES